MRHTPPVVCLTAPLLLLVCSSSSFAESSFNDVATIFAKHCVRCHNNANNEGDFSLETFDAFKDGDVVTPGDSDSHLLWLIQSEGSDRPEMPKEGEPLSEAEVDIISEWIMSGAQWPQGVTIDEPVSDFQWWSFQPISRPPVPKTADNSTPNPIDAFVIEQLRQKKLTPSPGADRKTLIRRVTHDLTGLPPTPEQVSEFVNDPDPLAYSKLVDRLLASKHYGERWARHWLDVVKYADTCGYDKDKLRPNAWPYRDYVIRSFNEDKPYSQFVREQIAGDKLFPGEPDGVLGLGFIAAGPWDFIGHVEVSESKIDGKVARNLDRDEMVSNTLNTFCSVTIECARCHNHKFDPFTQEHYYSLQALFAAVDRADRQYDIDPIIEKKREDLSASLSRQIDLQSKLEKEIADAGGETLNELEQLVSSLQGKVGLVKDPEFGYHSRMSDDSSTEKWVAIDLEQEFEIDKVVLHPCHDDFGGIGAGFGFPIRYRIEIASSDENWRVVYDANRDVVNPGITELSVSIHKSLVRHVRITATRLADRKGTYIFALAELEAIDTTGTNVAIDAKVRSLDSVEAEPRWSRKNLVDGKWPRPKNSLAFDKLQKAQRELLSLNDRIETSDRVARRKKIESQMTSIRKKLDALPKGKLVYAAATHFEPQSNFKPTEGKPRPIHQLVRGDVQRPLAEVNPGLPPLRADAQWQLPPDLSESDRRAALAHWLIDSNNPLVWRSIVNRVWQYHFGEGIVATPNDFGRMGAKPTHPELLDWLASEFRDSGQSLKQLHRLIVTSNTYRQSSTFNAHNAAIDGSNQYLWRMNRRRLSAEEIRDAILSVSGALDTSMGGPGFYLFELEKTEHSPHYEYHKFDPAEPKSHRRSIYRFIVRSQPDPYMTTLDCADSSQSTPRRIETLTSLQALSLLNNRFNLEMARRFADRLSLESNDLGEQIDRAMLLIASRRPSAEEHESLQAYAVKHGMANTCRMMFNLSEFVYLD